MMFGSFHAFRKTMGRKLNFRGRGALVKAKGAEIVRFFESKWPKDWYVDESVLSVYEGKILNDETQAEMPLTSAYRLSDFGVLMSDSGKSLTDFFKQWQKEQTHTVFIVEVPKSNAASFLESVKALGAHAK